MASEKLTPTQFSTWFQIIATVIMTLGLVVLAQVNANINNLAQEMASNRAIITTHLIDHPSHALDARLKVVESMVTKAITK